MFTMVTFEQLEAFLAAYPNPLVRDMLTIVEPATLQWNDFTRGVWPESVVAQQKTNYYTGGLDSDECSVLDSALEAARTRGEQGGAV